ncbi:MAG: hypothetical protein IKG93_10560 [Clostridiales bacterium]|nr:hypothetical protein [Clostridiales bacterium]
MSDSLFEKYSKSDEGKGKTKSKSSKKKKELPVIADYIQLPRETQTKTVKKAKKSETEYEEGFPQSIYVKIAGMNYRFFVSSTIEKAKTMYTAKIANDLLTETLEDNPTIPTNQALILAYMEAVFRWQDAIHNREEEKKEAPLLPLEQYCKENNIPMEEL